MAFHGGGLEEATDVIAQQAALATGSSYYGIHQPASLKWHVPSHRIDPQHSETLSGFINHVDTVITIHGFGRQGFFTSLLLGGRNRGLATHVAQHLRTSLPAYNIVDDLGHIPSDLAGQHMDNPVNRVRNHGVQIELPPRVRGASPMTKPAYLALSSIHCVNSREIEPTTKNTARNPDETAALTRNAR